MLETNGTFRFVDEPAYLTFLSCISNDGWQRLDQSVITAFKYPKSIKEIWNDIWTGQAHAVEKAFLMDKDNNVIAFYHRRLFNNILRMHEENKVDNV